MSNKASIVAIVGLSAVCVGLLLCNSLRCHAMGTSCNFAGSAQGAVPGASEQPGTSEPSGVQPGLPAGVSVTNNEQKNFLANEYVTTFRVVQRNMDKNVAYRRLNESRDKVLALLKKHSVGEKEYEFLSSSLEKKWSYIKGKRKYLGYEAAQEALVVFHGKPSADSLEFDLAGFPFIDNVRTRTRLKNADSLEVLVIQNACKKASTLADEYARSVGAEAGKVLSVEGFSDVEEMSSSDSVMVQASVSATLSVKGAENGARSFVRVSQSENKKFPADKFVVNVNVRLVGSDKESLFVRVAQKRDELARMAKDLGVAESEFNAESVNQRKRNDWEYDYDGGKDPYSVSQKILVNFTSKDAAAAFLDGVVSIENVNVLSARPVLKNEDSLRVQVTNVAGKKAMARAKAIAEGFGGNLGKVVSVSNEPNFEYGRVVLGGARNGGGALRKSPALAYDIMSNSPSAAGMNIADSVAISVYLDVLAEIR